MGENLGVQDDANDFNLRNSKDVVVISREG